MICHFI